jgi:hypothetical protein
MAGNPDTELLAAGICEINLAAECSVSPAFKPE